MTVILLAACASIGTPDGGPYDEEPPKILSTSPKQGSINSKAKKIVLLFDENVKLDNPSEKVIISPPQINQPEIEASGKRITVVLKDSLKPNSTYTIDFSDAIQDNNEGNPMEDYAFTFSTGEVVDTFQVSGYVLEAETLEPIKGILVGLYHIGNEEEDIPDSVFRTRELERVSRTDAAGHFIIKGLNDETQYRVFALKDMDQDFMFSKKAETIGFTRLQFTPSAKPDILQDTVWHDSIHYDSIVYRPYTHFYPDNIVLTAFTEEGQNRAFIKSDRPQLENFTLFFTAPDSVLPEIQGLNFDATNAFVIESNERKDTITYWVRDSLIYNNDTLSILLTYNYTDTLNQLVQRTDTQNIRSKISYEKVQKRKQSEYEEYRKEYIKEYKQRQKHADKDKDDDEEKGEKTRKGLNVAGMGEKTNLNTPPDSIINNSIDNINDNIDELEFDFEGDNPEGDIHEEDEIPDAHDDNQPDEDSSKGGKKKKGKKKKSNIKDEDIIVPPMPEKFLEVKISNTNISPDQNIDFTFNQPIDTIYTDKFHFSSKVDSIDIPKPFVIKRLPGTYMRYRFYAEWQPDSTYTLVVDTGAFVNIYGTRLEGMKKQVKVKGLDKFSQLTVNLQNAEDCSVVCLLNSSGKEVKRQKSEKGKVDFFYVDPGDYYLSLFYDRNGDGKWTTGDYDSQRQPEEVYYYPGKLNLRAQWEISQDWNPTSTPLFKQKPDKITKQKPDKKKDKKSKNQQREEEKAKRK